jgi:tetratricopeptide (TPR) repeat protein
VLRARRAQLRYCAERALASNAEVNGRMMLAFVIGPKGQVIKADVKESTLGNQELHGCIRAKARTWRFPEPKGGGIVLVEYPIVLRMEAGATIVRDDRPAVPRAAPYTGKFKKVMALLGKSKTEEAHALAFGWHEEDPGDVMALVALGEALEAAGDARAAARAYGSLIDLFPARADLRRFAGERLERLGSGEALRLAADTFAKAAEQRPDHPASHHLHAFALSKLGRHAEAFAALEAGLSRKYPGGRFAGVRRILREDLGLLAAAWIRAEPGRSDEVLARLRAAGGRKENKPSLRFVLNWETDANDVDFHIYDRLGGHASYRNTHLETGGDLYADVTTGYGPECFTIRNKPGRLAYPYRLQAHYYSRGPMGYGMGKLQIIEHDGEGSLKFDERPFVVMKDGAYLDLGKVKGPLGKQQPGQDASP